jgi:hypothetical protein
MNRGMLGRRTIEMTDGATSQTPGVKASSPFGPSNRSAWVSVTYRRPPQDVTVETKIDDSRGCRNQTFLKLHGRLWFVPDMSIYVYYEPSHWRMPNDKAEPRRDHEHP